ncbi:hypothetical protein HanRHA438_Chr13g0604181 [Helianthus annuus]|uniref:Uncharacterized protein n=1 Tax=Helianthus annuus TaxID=4232 RepID=A0A251SWM3_HELAN|nr:hypothetical protein HanXRQr2_Chr13g0593581 [Helianthus annuus]KAJ0477300.1 hypothetical protein HanHA300_Chr13g0486861 [Helianthus annuus]KAJ0481713.1 hypothetical protein HanIR_Chr13g0645701 [Helianthus annuus]KAJ0498133.1 hypothetical protein HanHA89_Chr13g0519001 [Helianthus annuus]KAJ0664135.1 hypothetical protein HanLR1_Chr13g0488851 [Helianthus annuus]
MGSRETLAFCYRLPSARTRSPPPPVRRNQPPLYHTPLLRRCATAIVITYQSPTIPPLDPPPCRRDQVAGDHPSRSRFSLPRLCVCIL